MYDKFEVVAPYVQASSRQNRGLKVILVGGLALKPSGGGKVHLGWWELD